MKRFNQLSKVLLLVLAVLARPSAQAAAQVAGTPAIARGPLRVHPTNPRYFTDGTKNPDGSLKAVYLTGSHTWNSLQDVTGNEWYLPNLISQQGFEAYLDFLVSHHHNFIRLWIVEHAWDEKSGARVSPHPRLRTGPGNALDGKLRFDLSKFDPAYFERLRSRVLAARDRGIYVSVMLFGGMWGTEHPSTWKGHPFHAANNINGIDGDANRDGLGNEIYTLRLAPVVALQKATATKVIETLNDLDNVLYEVANEVREYSTDWQYDIIKHVKAVEAGKPKQHPVGMTGYNSIPHPDLLNSPADWISPSPSGGDYQNSPPPADGKKVILIDTDHLWGEGGNPGWVWKSFTRGLHPIWMERIRMGAGDLPQAEAIRRAMGHTRRLAERMNLSAMTPRNELASTKYCLANPGKEYLVYLPEGGEVMVDLSAVEGEVRVEWIHPVEGKATSAEATTGGTKRTLKAPFPGEAVVHLAASQQQGGASTVFPGRDWAEAAPESQGVEGAKLKAAVAWLDTHAGPDGAKELVIIRNGYLIWKGPNADARHKIFSCSKVFTSTVLGLLVDDGKCRLDDRAIQFLPSLDDQHPAYARITLRHLASMSGGYRGVVRDVSPEQPWGDPLGYLLPQSPRYEAGAACAYHDHDVFLLGHILTRLAQQPLKEVFQRRIADPIGMTRWDWGVAGPLDNGMALNNAAGTPAKNPGIQTTALDLARLGHLYLKRGNWNGKPLLSAAFVDQATTNQVPTSRAHATGADPGGHYGLYWWTNGRQRNGQPVWPAAPPRTYAARGASANSCFVVPEWNMVIVRLATAPEDSKASDQTWNTFFEKLATALSKQGI
jgi:CubicO group peptidase (beta-lactamase class C family)